MKTSFLTFISILLFVFPTLLQAQSFEGVVTYKYKFKDKTGFLKPKDVKKLYGTQQKFYFKKDKYKNLLNGESQITETYLNDTLYITNKTVRAVMWVNAAKNTGKVISHSITKKAAVIDGVSCDLLKVRTSEGTIEYYFNSKYKIDREQFANHNYQYRAFCLEMTDGAIPLKFVFNTKKSYLEITCTDIQALNVAESVFDLPTGVAYIQKPKRMR